MHRKKRGTFVVTAIGATGYAILLDADNKVIAFVRKLPHGWTLLIAPAQAVRFRLEIARELGLPA